MCGLRYICRRLKTGKACFTLTFQPDRIGKRAGMRLMWRDGLEKAALGQTTLEEVLKAAAIVATNSEQPQAKMSA